MINLKTIKTQCATELCSYCRVPENQRNPEEDYCQNCEDFYATVFVCPDCKTVDTYEGSVCPVICKKCKTLFEDLEMLRTDYKTRIEFHMDLNGNF